MSLANKIVLATMTGTSTRHLGTTSYTMRHLLVRYKQVPNSTLFCFALTKLQNHPFLVRRLGSYGFDSGVSPLIIHSINARGERYLGSATHVHMDDATLSLFGETPLSFGYLVGAINALNHIFNDPTELSSASIFAVRQSGEQTG